MRAELPIMNCVLSDVPSHKVGCEEQHSVSKWKQYIWDWAQAGPEGTSKLYEEVAQMPVAPTPGTLSSLSLPALMASWGVLYGQVTEENKAKASFTDGSARYADTIWKWTAIAPTASFWDIPEGNWWRDEVSRTSSSTFGCSLCWKEKWPDVWLYTDSWAVTNSLARWSGTQKAHDLKIGIKKIWEEACG